MVNTVSGDRWWCGNERSVEGQRLTCLPVAGSVGVRQVENPSVASLSPFLTGVIARAGHASPSAVSSFFKEDKRVAGKRDFRRAYPPPLIH